MPGPMSRPLESRWPMQNRPGSSLPPLRVWRTGARRENRNVARKTFELRRSQLFKAMTFEDSPNVRPAGPMGLRRVDAGLRDQNVGFKLVADGFEARRQIHRLANGTEVSLLP